MRTDTREQIIKIIEKRGKVRPSELKFILGLSPQAIHRHLRRLVDEGILESRGSAPFTEYALAGIPDLEGVVSWLKAPTLGQNPEARVCETRDTFAARLPRLKSLIDHGLPTRLLPLVISVAGELGNNSFDHNLGQWRDVPGCWFEYQLTGHYLWACIADRGQGIRRSLARVHPGLTGDQAALKAAFEQVISGRAPERRGNGLKFVRQTMLGAQGGGVACNSGIGRIHYGAKGENCAALLDENLTQVEGTITLVVWGIQ